MSNPILHNDFETRSELDLELVGLDNYSRHPSTQVLMLSWALDEGKVQLWEPHLSPQMPSELKGALLDPEIIKCAWNATFERTIFKKLLNIHIPYQQWVDPSIWARHLSMPGKLEKVAPILGLRTDEAKLEEGKRLIDKFSLPESKSGEFSLFNVSTAFFRDWETDPADWKLFGDYCKRDTVSERAALKKMAKFPLPAIEQRGWILDQKINDIGMPVDMDLVQGAITIAYREQEALDRQMKELTDLQNPNSVPQMLAWVRNQGYPFNSLGKEEVTRALSADFVNSLTAQGKQALKLRQQASKTSFKKYEAIRLNAGPGDSPGEFRLRQQFSFLGAARAGRWTGHDVQLQNLPRPTKELEKKMERAVTLLRENDELTLMLEFSSVMDVVASCVRSSFRAPEGKKLVVCDLNAIENRGLGWLARCDSILKVFRDGKCPYLSFAARLFNVPYEELNAAYERGDPAAKEMRQGAKPAVLGAGYRLGGGEEILNKDGDIIKTGLWGYAEGMSVRMAREDAHRAVQIFRETYPEVVQLWYDLENASIKAVHTGEPQEVGPVRFECYGRGKEKKLLRILLPSGRSLHYIRPKVEKMVFRDRPKDTLTYDGINQETRQWTRVSTHGGKLTENIVQAISRDILLNGMFLADEKGIEIGGHVHDEIIALALDLEARQGLDLKDLRECMIARPEWALGFPLDADGYESKFYKKG